MAAMPAFAASSPAPPPEVKPGAYASVPASASGPPETEVTKSTHIGVQVSNALLGLTVTAASNSPTAPDAVQPLPQSSTAVTAFAVGDATASQGTDNDSAGSDMNNSEGSGSNSQNAKGNTAAQNAANTAKSAAGANAKTETVANFSPLPIIPQWHIRPRTKIA